MLQIAKLKDTISFGIGVDDYRRVNVRSVDGYAIEQALKTYG
jgi:hypothetical protein